MMNTGAADVGTVLMDLGGAAKAAPSGQGADQGFASTLEGQKRRAEGGAAASEGKQRDTQGQKTERGGKSKTDRTGEPKEKAAAERETEAPATEEDGEGKLQLHGEAEQTGKTLPSEKGGQLPPEFIFNGQATAAVPAGTTNRDAASPGGGQAGEQTAAGQSGLQRLVTDALTAQDAGPEAASLETDLVDEAGGKRGADRFLELLAAGRSAIGKEPAEGEAFARLSGGVQAAGGVATAGPTPTPVPNGPANPAPATSVNVPMGQPGWDKAFGERVVWMARDSVQEAQIQLNPRHLGPVELKVTVNQDQVNVQFNVSNPATREAVEAAMPRLREMLGDSGLNLAHAGVSDQSQQGREGQGDGGDDGGAGAGPAGLAGWEGEDEEMMPIGESVLPEAAAGAVDFFA